MVCTEGNCFLSVLSLRVRSTACVPLGLISDNTSRWSGSWRRSEVVLDQTAKVVEEMWQMELYRLCVLRRRGIRAGKAVRISWQALRILSLPSQTDMRLGVAELELVESVGHERRSAPDSELSHFNPDRQPCCDFHVPSLLRKPIFYNQCLIVWTSYFLSFAYQLATSPLGFPERGAKGSPSRPRPSWVSMY